MPCYDPETHEYPKRLAAKVNHLTELLCSTCAVLFCDETLYDNAISPELRAWWKNHQIIDAKIRVMEAKRRRGEPLTSEEIGLIYSE